MALSVHTRAFFVLVALLALSGIVYAVSVMQRETPPSVIVSRAAVVQQVSVTGKAKAVQEVDLAFQAGGTITSVQARVGSRVTLGDVLAQLDEEEMRAKLREAEANRDAEAAKLADLKSGARAEDVAVYEARRDSARSSMADAGRELTIALRNAYTSADDAIDTKSDRFFDYSGGDYVLLIEPPDRVLVQSIESVRESLEAVFIKWESVYSAPLSLEGASASLQFLKQVQSFLLELSQAVNAPNASTAFTTSTLTTYRADLSLARATIDTAIANVQNALSAYRSSSADVEIAERTLESEKAGSTALALDAQAARVKQYEAQVANIIAQLSKANLISPITGVVTRQDAKIGQIARAGEPLVSVISDADLEIEANVPEISIGKVTIGNAVKVVFDAFPEETFDGSVAAIEPAETIIDGVTNYKITIALAQKDARLRRGLTADLTIIRGSREGVLVLPEYTITRDGNRASVTVLRKGARRDITIQTGMKGENGATEIVSGLAEGDEVLLPFAASN